MHLDVNIWDLWNCHEMDPRSSNPIIMCLAKVLYLGNGRISSLKTSKARHRTSTSLLNPMACRAQVHSQSCHNYIKKTVWNPPFTSLLRVWHVWACSWDHGHLWDTDKFESLDCKSGGWTLKLGNITDVHYEPLIHQLESSASMPIWGRGVLNI